MANFVLSGGRLLDLSRIIAVDPEPNAGGPGVAGVRVWLDTPTGTQKKDYAGVTVAQMAALMEANGIPVAGN